MGKFKETPSLVVSFILGAAFALLNYGAISIADFGTLIFSVLASWLAYLAYLNTLERLRLDLLDKRWDFYLALLEFCSIVQALGGLPNTKNEDWEKLKLRAYDLAGKSFRGQGFHLSKILFGKDVEKIIAELNKAYAHFVSYSDVDTLLEYNQIEERHNYLRAVIDITTDLPDIFRPYMYFGDYHRNRIL